MTNVFGGLISEPDVAEEWILKPEKISIEISKTKDKRGKKPDENSKENIQALWVDYKRCNICVMGISEGKKDRNRNNI